MRFIKYIISFLLIALLSTKISATGTGPYFGLQVGGTNLNNNPYYVNTGIPSSPPTACNLKHPATCITTPAKVKPNNTGIGERLYFGIQMNRYAGVEIGATNYAPSVYDPKIPESNKPAIRAYALDISVKGIYSLYNFSVFGKIGGAGVRQTATGALTKVSLDGVRLHQVPESQNSGHVMAAAGVSFDISANWVLDLSVSRIFKGSNFKEADFYGLGIAYHWVDLYCGQFLC